MRKAAALLIAVLTALCIWSWSPVALADPTPTITPHPTLPASKVEDNELRDDALHLRSAILADSDTGTVMYEYDADSRQYPASITKIMTCLLAIEYSEDTAEGLQEKVKVQPFEPLRSDYSKIGMKEGEVYTLEQLLYGLMLPSGNDAAIAIADHVAGSLPNFAELMNEKAQELGMTGTHFVNPHGIHDEDHYTTARDMMRLGMAAMENDTFRQIVGTPTYTCPATNKNEARKWTNSNRFFGVKYPEFKWEPMVGIKTGYTDAALHTFVGALSYEGREMISVVLGSPDSATRFTETKLIMRYGLRYYDNMDLAEVAGRQELTLAIPNAEDPAPAPVSLDAASPILATLPVADTDALTLDPGKLTVKITPAENLSAPLAQGTVVGTAEISYNGVVYGTADVTVDQNVAVNPTVSLTPEPSDAPTDEAAIPDSDLIPATPPSTLRSRAHQALMIILGVLLVLVAAGILFCVILPMATGRRRRTRRSSNRRSTAPASRSRRIATRGRRSAAERTAAARRSDPRTRSRR